MTPAEGSDPPRRLALPPIHTQQICSLAIPLSVLPSDHVTRPLPHSFSQYPSLQSVSQSATSQHLARVPLGWRSPLAVGGGGGARVCALRIVLRPVSSRAGG